jgi:hypothetical protein
MQQQKERLNRAFDNMSELDRIMLVTLAEDRANAFAKKRAVLRLVPNLLPPGASSLFRTAS